MSWLRWWVGLWDRKEAPDILALVRIGVGLVLLYDFLVVYRLSLVEDMLSTVDYGGLVPSGSTAPFVEWFGGGRAAGRALHAGLVFSALSLSLGFFSRTSATVLMLLSAQWALMLVDADRAIDTLLRNVLLILAFSGCGKRWSIDAWLSTGSFRGDGALVSSAPRLLLVLQVVVMYFTAGVQKYGQHWWPWGGYTALYVILQDWSYATIPFAWLKQQPFYLGTQIASAITMIWQWTYPIVILHYLPLPQAPGRFRQFFARYRLHWLWILVGALFHLMIGATMELGIFPAGMLAVYPAFLHPDELKEIADSLSRRARSLRTSAG